MSRVVAIFDVDQTLVRGYTERLFFRYLVRHRVLSLPRALVLPGPAGPPAPGPLPG